MHKELAIRLQKVSKIYKLHGCQSDQLIDVLGLQRFGFRTRTPAKKYAALSDISLEVPRGHRIGIVGRNGAGKTTLLKLICGNFAPTTGDVEINGTVQALMSVGLGFHPEFTGRENVEASLQYNGLGEEEYSQAMEGIIEFCELGDFLDQPFKTYSLGMQARLMFAAATAIRPDILIVDEVLGAGDAYFVAKSKTRVEKLVNSGCTMLLVSHSMQQVLELCDEAIWLDQGRIKMQGKAFDVVKAYEAYLHGPINGLAADRQAPLFRDGKPLAQTDNSLSADTKSAQGSTVDIIVGHRTGSWHLQEPAFRPHGDDPTLADIKDTIGFDFVAPGGISRWAGEGSLQFTGFSIVQQGGISNVLTSLSPAKLVMEFECVRAGEYSCRYSINISDHLGQTVCSVKSPEDRFVIDQGGRRRLEVLFNPLQLGPGEYTVGMVILGYTALEILNTAIRYDLLSRSFEFKVENPASWATLQNQFFHSAEWRFT